MKVEEVVETIAKFFNDLIGAWVPGAVLAVGLAAMHLGPAKVQGLAKIGDGTGVALIFAGILFALGHALSAIHEYALKPLLKLLRVAKSFDEAEAKKRESFEWFAAMAKDAQGKGGPQSWSYNDLRSVAFSVSAEAASIGRRFMFISLLCNGVGAALVIMGIDYLTCYFILPKLLHSYEHAAPWFIQVALVFGTAWSLFKRGDAFYERAMATPFSIAVAELKFKKESNGIPPSV